MANTFDNLVDKIFAKSLIKLRENSIMPRLVNTDFSDEVAKQGSTIDINVPVDVTVTDVAPSHTPIQADSITSQTVSISLNRWRKTHMHLTDKEVEEIAYDPLNTQLDSHMQALANDVDSYLFGLFRGTYGFSTGGVTGTAYAPFSADLKAATEARRILSEQLAPMSPRYMVLGPEAEANALNQRAIADASYRRQGEDTTTSGMIGHVLGFDWVNDQNVPTHTQGAPATGSAYLTAATAAVGATSVAIDGGGATGSVNVGDIFTVAGDTQTYVATAAISGATGTLEFAPSARVAWADNAAVTLAADHELNIAFHRDAVGLAVRPLMAPQGFTGGNIMRTVADEISRLAMTLEISRQENQNRYQWSILYGATLVRPELSCRVPG